MTSFGTLYLLHSDICSKKFVFIFMLSRVKNENTFLTLYDRIVAASLISMFFFPQALHATSVNFPSFLLKFFFPPNNIKTFLKL